MFAGLDTIRFATYAEAMAANAKRKGLRLPNDVAMVGGPTEDGEGKHLLRLRDGNLSLGEVRPAKDGKPVMAGELVRLKPLEAAPYLHEVEVLHSVTASQERSGPASVANDTYRRNWSTVFGTGRVKAKRQSDWDLN